MPNLRDWEEVKIPSGAEVKVFPCLEYLEIKRCNQLSSAPSQFTGLKELVIWRMDSELPLASICGIKLKTLMKLEIWSIEGLICLPDWLFHNNQHLLVLDIRWCPKLRELPDGLHSLNSLENLQIGSCESLGSIPGISQGLASLRKLSIVRCPGLRNFLCEMEESCAPLLEDLTIDVGSSDAWDCVSFKKAVDGILRSRSCSLRRLELWVKEDWESDLPDQIQNLTSLTELKLGGFGIDELPEWFGNLSSLQELQLGRCSKLKHLPSVEAMRRLTNLSTLSIINCPLLEKRCRKQRGSEWPKISNIPNVRCY